MQLSVGDLFSETMAAMTAAMRAAMTAAMRVFVCGDVDH